jgi:hypothetical protein
MYQNAQKELEKLEYQNRTWNSKFFKELQIWEEIAININSHTGQNQKFWVLVMELYHKKYKKYTK